MIKTFKTKGLAEFHATGKSKKIASEHQPRLLHRLSVLHRARTLEAVNVPGFKFHPLHGFKPTRYSIWVSGAWRVTFEWLEGDAYNVEFEQYH